MTAPSATGCCTAAWSPPTPRRGSRLGRRPHDTRLSALVAELRLADSDVVRWWDDHGVRNYTSVAKQIRHPLAGDLSFDIEIVSPPNEPDQRLVVYTTDPDSPTTRMLPLLHGWAADEVATLLAAVGG